MHYKIGNCLIKSENAAKSHKQQSIYLRNLINSEDKIESTLDYGCGKLRYSEILVSKSSKQVFIDSQLQLERQQIIHNERTSITEFVKIKYRNASTIALENIDNIADKFDFILCSNVISAIPCVNERSKSIKRIKRLLKNGGKALFVCQYKDIYFESYKSRADCEEYFDGFLIKNKKSYSFYGLITPIILEKLITDNGMKIIRKIDRKGSIYIYAN